jgi:hypothetical protein
LEPLAFLIGISNFLLVLQKTFVISFGLEKIPQKYPQNYIIFKGLGMILVIKKTPLKKENCIRKFNTSILRYLQNNFKYFQIFKTYFQNCHKVQFKESIPTIGRMYPKIIILFP